MGQKRVARFRRVRPVGVVLRFTALAAVTLIGAAACGSGPQGEPVAAERPPLVASGGAAGASATPVPNATPAAPSATATPDQTAGPTADESARPTPSRSASTKPTAAARSGCPQGEKQRQVERDLAELGGFGPVEIDGRQSPTDCAAIKKFQRRYGIYPAEGRAGPVTADVARRLARTDTTKCDAGKGMTFCVDLTLQTAWAMRDGKVVMAPTVVRTGMAGYATATGHYKINARNVKEWSRPYKVWLPYWQHFTMGMGFHETTTYLHDKSIGSHGCVNMLPRDVRELWELGSIGTRVHVFGRRPGT